MRTCCFFGRKEASSGLKSACPRRSDALTRRRRQAQTPTNKAESLLGMHQRINLHFASGVARLTVSVPCRDRLILHRGGMRAKRETTRPRDWDVRVPYLCPTLRTASPTIFERHLQETYPSICHGRRHTNLDLCNLRCKQEDNSRTLLS